VSLRARLLIGLAALATLGLGAMAIVTYEEQRSFLLQRVDQQVGASAGLVAGQLGAQPGGPLPLRLRRIGLLPRRRPNTFQASGTYGELLGPTGELLKVDAFAYGAKAGSPPVVPRKPPVSKFGTGPLHIFTVDSRAGSGLRYRAAAFAVGDGRTVVVAVPLREADQTLHRLLVVEGLVGAGVILTLLVLGWVVVRLGLQPLERIGRVAREIAHGDLSRRVTPATPRTEVGRLGLSLNDMLMQIEQAFADRQHSEDRLRQFVADASHELRTPLASIRAYTEAFRLGAATDPETLERAMARTEGEVARMGVLVEDLLLLARLNQLPEERRQQVDLSELVEHAADDARAIAPERSIGVSRNGPLLVLADRDQLRQVLANLTRNALTHTPTDSPIEVAVWREHDRAVVEVRDHGPGLPAETGDKVFERFWRTDQGRRRGPGGAGLGLAIVKAIVDAHHGEVHARNAADGGAVFRVELPASDAPGRADTHAAALRVAPKAPAAG
jgi:two-component system, OmpR family, sensor kinase